MSGYILGSLGKVSAVKRTFVFRKNESLLNLYRQRAGWRYSARVYMESGLFYICIPRERFWCIKRYYMLLALLGALMIKATHISFPPAQRIKGKNANGHRTAAFYPAACYVEAHCNF
jgi:hypothetical protein